MSDRIMVVKALAERIMIFCPICGSQAEALDKTGDATGFDCPLHGRFKVSSTVLATRSIAARAKWETALERAKTRQPNEWAPCIQTVDF
jgi:transcription elongation factor Elf1